MLAGLRTAEASDELVPPGLVVGVRGRLRSLQPGTLRFLQMGAVLGRRFGFHDAAALCGRTTATLIAALEEAVRAGLLDDDGDHLAFRHDLLRQAVYADIPPSARKALHREAAHHLVSAGHQPIDAVPHILRGALPGDEEAVALLRRAADDVLPVTPGLAADLMTRALELVPPARPLRFAVGEQMILCMTRAGRNREALSAGDRLLAAGHRWRHSVGCRLPSAGRCGTWISPANCAAGPKPPSPWGAPPGDRGETGRPARTGLVAGT